MHAHETRNLDALARTNMVDECTLLQAALVNAHVRELSEAPLLKLERESNQRRRSSRHERYRRRRHRKSGVMRDDVAFRRIREVGADAIKERLHTNVLDSGTQEDRGELEVDRSAPERSDELLQRRGLISKDEVGNFVVDLGELLNEFLALFLGQGNNRFRNLVRFADRVSNDRTLVIRASLVA